MELCTGTVLTILVIAAIQGLSRSRQVEKTINLVRYAMASLSDAGLYYSYVAKDSSLWAEALLDLPEGEQPAIAIHDT